jgi:hypothetical protein
MDAAIVGLLALGALVFVVGMISARHSSRRYIQEQRTAFRPSEPSVSRTPTDDNAENPAMAMAGATGANKFGSDTRPHSLRQ